jgi:hypothetical protein
MSSTPGRIVLGLAAAAALAAGAPAQACSVCGCGDPMLAESDPAALSGKLRVGLDTEYLQVKSGTPSDVLNQYTLRLDAVYSPAPGLSVIAQIPYLQKKLDNAGGDGSNLNGLGDIELGARYAVLDLVDVGAARRQTLAFSAGTSLPTGLRATSFDGHDVDEHGQPGTGAWGPFLGVHYRLEQMRWTGFASATGRVRTTNGDGYHYGNAFLWSVHGQYWLVPKLAVDLGLDGRYAAADTIADGSEAEDTGGTVLAASPAVYWNVSGPLWLSARAQVPFYTHLFGAQSIGPTVVAGLQYLVF